MKRLFSLCCLALLVLAGCDDPGKKLPEQARELAQQFIAQSFDQDIRRNSSFKVYRIGNDTIILISDSTFLVPEGRGHETVRIARLYNASKITYALKTCETKRVIRSEKSEYPFESILFVEYLDRKEIFADTEGIEVSIVLPYDWEAMSERDRERFIQSKISTLPIPEFDYYKIAHGQGQVIERTTSQQIDVRYSARNKRWELSSAPEPVTLKVETPSWYTGCNPGAAGAVLSKNGYIKVGGTYMTPADAEIRRKLENGYFYLNGQWVSRRNYEFRKILAAHPRSNYSFQNILDLLARAQAYQDAEDFPEARQLIARQTQEFVNFFSKSQKHLVMVKNSFDSNPAWKIIDLTAVRNDVETKLANIRSGRARDLEERKNRAFLPYTDAEKAFADLLKSKDAATARAFLDSLRRLPQRSELRQSGAAYVVLLAAIMKDQQLQSEAGNLLSSDMNRHLQEDLLTFRCRNCRNGLAKCRYCGGTGVCRLCGGTGRIETLSPEISGGRSGRFSRGTEYRPCPTQCQYCARQKCPSCGGKGRIRASAAQLGNHLATFKSKFENGLNDVKRELQREFASESAED